jgi:hypothetical protein
MFPGIVDVVEELNANRRHGSFSSRARTNDKSKCDVLNGRAVRRTRIGVNIRICDGNSGLLVPEGQMKVAQHEVLGKDAKGSVRPAGDDRNVWLLVSYTTTQGVNRSSLAGRTCQKTLTQH